MGPWGLSLETKELADAGPTATLLPHLLTLACLAIDLINFLNQRN